MINYYVLQFKHALGQTDGMPAQWTDLQVDQSLDNLQEFAVYAWREGFKHIEGDITYLHPPNEVKEYIRFRILHKTEAMN